jgi:hypothetical protein
MPAHLASASPAPIIKGLDLLPDLLSDKMPEKFLQFAQTIFNSLGFELLADRILDIEGIAPGILDIFPWQAPQVKKIPALPAAGCGIIAGDPDNIFFSPVYGMFCQIHLPCPAIRLYIPASCTCRFAKLTYLNYKT